ncbi:hypothetical protein PFISCL1PPCAC_12212, partial [Pristionchus fissidentatus]
IRGMMAAPPAKAKDEDTITMNNLDPRTLLNKPLTSPVTRIGGFPWRVRVDASICNNYLHVTLICDKSTESELWWCKGVTIITIFGGNPDTNRYYFDLASWDQKWTSFVA